MKALSSMLLGGVLGFGLGLATVNLAPPADQVDPAASSIALRNRPAPGFKLPTGRDQEAITLADYRGKVVLLTFFETGCPSCHQELPELVKLHQALRKKGVEVIGVALDPVGAQDLAGLAQELSISYPLALGDARIARDYGGIPGVPTSFVIDRQGRISEVFPEAVGYETLSKAVQRVL